MSEATDVARYNLKVKRGATMDKQFLWSTGGVPNDLTGYTAKFQIRGRVEDTETLLELTTGAGITLNSPTTGYVRIQRTAAQTLALTFSRGWYGVSLIRTSDGFTKVLIEGDVLLPLASSR